jgi:hypothetical protein
VQVMALQNMHTDMVNIVDAFDVEVDVRSPDVDDVDRIDDMAQDEVSNHRLL